VAPAQTDSRHIPVEVRRQLRREAGFGCVICGDPLITYHHFDPPFDECGTHDPKGMVSLCGRHHARADRKGRDGGLYSTAEMRSFKNNPHNCGVMKDQRLDPMPATLLGLIGGIPAVGTDLILRVSGAPRLRVRSEQGRATIDTALITRLGEELALVEENGLLLRTSELHDAEFCPRSYRWLMDAGESGTVEIRFRRLSARDAIKLFVETWASDEWLRQGLNMVAGGLMGPSSGPTSTTFQHDAAETAARRVHEWLEELGVADGMLPLLTVSARVPYQDAQGNHCWLVFEPWTIDLEFGDGVQAVSFGDMGTCERPAGRKQIPWQRCNPLLATTYGISLGVGLDELVSIGTSTRFAEMAAESANIPEPAVQAMIAYLKQDFWGGLWSRVAHLKWSAENREGALEAFRFARDTEPAERMHHLRLLQAVAECHGLQTIETDLAIAFREHPSDQAVLRFNAQRIYEAWRAGGASAGAVRSAIRAVLAATVGRDSAIEKEARRVLHEMSRAPEWR
jgi:hypothetical protein